MTEVYIMTFMKSRLYDDPSGKLLAENGGFNAVNTLRHLRRRQPYNILIRYGITDWASRGRHFREVINKFSSLKLAQDKLRSALLFNDSYQIKSPKVWTNKNYIYEDDLPVLRRRRFHSRGTDIKKIDTMRELRYSDGDYWVKFIEADTEYRVHFFKGEAIRIQLKVLKKEDEEGNKYEPHYIHNVAHNYTISDHFKRKYDLEKKVIESALKTAELVELDFGAVDVLVDKDGEPYVLEVNTAPRLCTYGVQLYTYIFQEYLNKKYDLDFDLDLEQEKFSRLRVSKRHFTNIGIRFRDCWNGGR